MRKLKLRIDRLQVESFPVAHQAPGTGTVRGHDSDEEPVFLDDGYAGAYTVGTCIGPTFCCPVTWKPTCPDTCYSTCQLSCDVLLCFP